LVRATSFPFWMHMSATLYLFKKIIYSNAYYLFIGRECVHRIWVCLRWSIITDKM
jgi:hypothetical protein